MNRRLEEARRHCIRLTRRSGSNFVRAFCVLPGEMSRDMSVLYAFMRRTDDLGDAGTRCLAERTADLADWRQALAAALTGSSVEDPILFALAELCSRRGLSGEPLFDVISGVESDLTPRHFRTSTELEGYCRLVAGAVGLCCIKIWGYEGPEPREQAIACGHAFQWTNILRDLVEDRRAGRFYLPLEDLARYDLTPESLFADAARDRARELIRFEVERAWDFHSKARPILQVLSPPGRRIQAAFLELYGSLLREIEVRDYDVFSRRVRLSRWRKWTVSLRCLLGLEATFTAADTRPTSTPRPQPTR